jgi:hypothetical protein
MLPIAPTLIYKISPNHVAIFDNNLAFLYNNVAKFDNMLT